MNIPAADGILHIDYDNLASVGLGVAEGPETISYTAYNSGTGAVTGMVRGLAGTTDVDHGNGATVQLGNSALLLKQLNDDISSIGAAADWVGAGETWVYAGADDPTFTFTISGDKTAKYSAGMKIKLDQTTTKYFIITAVSYGAPNTTVTIYGGTDYDLANEAITNPYYSSQKAPFGFPLDPTKWTVEATSTSDSTQASPTITVWYNHTSIAIPLGVWRVTTAYTINGRSSGGGQIKIGGTLSTANNSESDADLSCISTYTAGSGAPASGGRVFTEKVLVLAAKATYYLNYRNYTESTTVGVYGSVGKTVIKAICSYL